MSIHFWLNIPLLAAKTLSPADNVLLSAVSQPPEPVDGKMKTSPAVVFRTCFTPDSAGCNISLKAAERWSNVGISTARRRDSGIFVGPGMKIGFCMFIGEPFEC